MHRSLETHSITCWHGGWVAARPVRRACGREEQEKNGSLVSGEDIIGCVYLLPSSSLLQLPLGVGVAASAATALASARVSSRSTGGQLVSQSVRRHTRTRRDTSAPSPDGVVKVSKDISRVGRRDSAERRDGSNKISACGRWLCSSFQCVSIQ